MEVASVSITPLDGFWIRIGVKEENRDEIHESFDNWLDKVGEKMKGGEGLEEIVNELFKKRQELMGEVATFFIKKLYSEELNRETAVCPRCGKEVKRAGEHERTVETMIGEIKLKRPYFWCESCKKGFYPLDKVLDLSNRKKRGICRERGRVWLLNSPSAKPKSCSRN
ncbi:hypothetical protein DRN97_11780 [Methanosarcinales archaeon]|nr:MAG: hypothetical protein DRN97_11780 [Methanosarcinales archaeon]